MCASCEKRGERNGPQFTRGPLSLVPITTSFFSDPSTAAAHASSSFSGVTGACMTVTVRGVVLGFRCCSLCRLCAKTHPSFIDGPRRKVRGPPPELFKSEGWGGDEPSLDDHGEDRQSSQYLGEGWGGYHPNLDDDGEDRRASSQCQ